MLLVFSTLEGMEYVGVSCILETFFGGVEYITSAVRVRSKSSRYVTKIDFFLQEDVGSFKAETNDRRCPWTPFLYHVILIWSTATTFLSSRGLPASLDIARTLDNGLNDKSAVGCQ